MGAYLSGYKNLQVYYGDIHSHCHEVGYGYGSVEEAYANAASQLDFASVTAHAHWPDLPVGEKRLTGTVKYHLDGFQRAEDGWSRLLEITNAANEPGQFVTFPSFEWHSLRHGDHNVYFRNTGGKIIRAHDLKAMRTHLRRMQERGTDAFLLPHHIGYLSGYRGINWADFSSEFSPVVEIFSMHGLAESDDAPYPYLHTMGPRDERSTMQYGLREGNLFGVIGSTDHHSAFPGSYGYGRMAVWAEDLTRDAIWDAIAARRTYALSGDRVALSFSVNGQPMGAVVPSCSERWIEVVVTGGDSLDTVEVLHNNRVIQRWGGYADLVDDAPTAIKVFIEFGWGGYGNVTDWDVELSLSAGDLVGVEPRFRGRDIVAPNAGEDAPIVMSQWRRQGKRSVHFFTQTWGNPTIHTPATQGVSLEIMGDDKTKIYGRINGKPVQVSLGELKSGARTGYLGTFLSPAYSFHRAVPISEYQGRYAFLHRSVGDERDWYYVRIRQKNGQGAWSSPIWVERTV